MADTEPIKTEIEQKDVTEDPEQSLELQPINISVVTPSSQTLQIQVTLSDTVQDIRQFLLDEANTCYLTSYHLEHSGKQVSDFVELSELELKDGDKLLMIEDEYNETTARSHVRKLREIVSSVPSTQRKESPSLLSHFEKESSKQTSGLRSSGQEEHVLFSEFFPETEQRVKCVKKITFSSWNPPPPSRHIQGDLFYLEIQTLEGTTVTVTACTTGFFVNSTKQGTFNPNPLEKDRPPYHSLVELLEVISQQFKTNFSEILRTSFAGFGPIVDTLAVPYPVIPWLSRPEAHTYDPNRAEEYIISSAEIDFNIQGQLRDWNEELQQSRSLPRETINEKVIRDRALFRSHCDYVDAAVRGAVAIVDGNVPPINPTDEPKAHMFIFNNIFFSFAVDSRDIYKDLGGDETAYKQASNELLGVSAYNKVDIAGLHTAGTVIVTYRGHRLVAQTIIPGLFSSLAQEDGHVNIGYGSLEGNQFKVEPSFHELMLKAAEQLLIKPHKVTDKTEKSTVTLAAHADIKGIIGSDQRHYILDLVRTTPRDANFPSSNNIGAILRPELLEHYAANLQQTMQKEKLEKLKAEEQQRMKANVELEKDKPKEETDKGTKNGEETKKSEPSAEYLKELKKLAAEVVSVPPFNPDTFTPTILGDSDEKKVEDEEQLKKLAAFLKGNLIPSLVEELLNYQVPVVDSATLTSAFHSRGINLRYMGHITSLISAQSTSNSEHKSPILVVLYREMIVRAAKRIFGNYIKLTKDSHLANTVSHLLNAFFGKITPVGKGSRSGFGVAVSSTSQKSDQSGTTSGTPQKLAKRIKDGSLHQKDEALLKSLNHNQLWAQIRSRVSLKYNFELPEMIPSAIFGLSTLRALCLQVGIQIVARDYDLSKEEPFKPQDVLRLFPIVKQAHPWSSDAYELLEAGKSYMSQGRLDVAFDLFSECLNILQQVYGPLQRDVSLCHSNLARLLLATGDVQQAASHQQKAVVINERILGLDHYETSTSYLTLGLLTHQINSKSRVALSYIKRANFLNHVIGGIENPENISTYTHLAGALQDLEEKEEAQYFFGKALSLCEQLHGQKHLQTARLNHQMAIAHRLAGNLKEALNYETKNYEICKQLLGESHIQTMEANIWLTHITRDAVQDAKAQNPRKGIRQKAPPKQDSGTTSVGGNINTQQQFNNLLSNMDIMDLVKFIQDPNTSAQPKTLNRFGPSSSLSSASHVGRGGPPKRTFPGGASAVSRSPKHTGSASPTPAPSSPGQKAEPSAQAATPRDDDAVDASSTNKKKRKRRKNKNKGGDAGAGGGSSDL